MVVHILHRWKKSGPERVSPIWKSPRWEVPTQRFRPGQLSSKARPSYCSPTPSGHEEVGSRFPSQGEKFWVWIWLIPIYKVWEGLVGVSELGLVMVMPLGVTWLTRGEILSDWKQYMHPQRPPSICARHGDTCWPCRAHLTSVGISFSFHLTC